MDEQELEPSIYSQCINANGYLRSREMQFYRMTFPRDCMRDLLFSVAKLDCCHFLDLNPNSVVPSGYDPTFLLDIKKHQLDCVQYQHQLYQLEDRIKAYNIELPPMNTEVGDLADSPSHNDLLSDLSNYLTPLTTSLTQNIQFKTEIDVSVNNIREHIAVVEMCYSSEEDSLPSDSSTPLLGTGGETGILRSLCGTIPRSRLLAFERVIFRLSRGKCIFRSSTLEGTFLSDSVPVQKDVFCAYFLSSHLEAKISRLASGFQASLYTVPSSRMELQSLQSSLLKQLAESQQVQTLTSGRVRNLLQTLALGQGDAPSLRYWQREVAYELAIYDAARKLVATRDYIHAQAWIPTSLTSIVRDELNYTSTKSGHAQIGMWIQATIDQPPTSFPTNKFTSAFQALVDTYGIPRYGEINPGLYSIISFPFLFGIMFGDLGHGLGLILFALWLLHKEKDHEEQKRLGKLDEMVIMIHEGRYLILLMGIFAAFAGLIYNEIFSISYDFFGTGWVEKGGVNFTQIDVYPVGMDPVWHGKGNEILFYNSFKMKMSVVVGVIQMIFGLLISLFNHIHFGEILEIYLDFIPQMIFMLSFFGYMILLIIIKWCIDWTPLMAAHITPNNLIQQMMNMVLNPGSLDYEMIPGMAAIQSILVILALLCVPIMFFAVPVTRYVQHSRAINAHQPLVEGEEDPLVASRSKKDSQYSFGDDILKQSIHTIEFILGAVSNTASYLRLWALSLAHTALSEVFWDKLLVTTLNSGNPVMLVAGFAIWCAITVGILGCMDSLECFLHALRLHWVEWENKFFHGDGYLFQPVSFSAALTTSYYKKE